MTFARPVGSHGRYIRILLLTGVVVWSVPKGLTAQTSVVNSKHNLSISGPGTIKAQSEQEVCAFCHTPHHADAAAQLWNKQPTSASYILYSSDYLTSIRPGYSPSQPNPKSKLCMSCHDGTVALGLLYNRPGSGMGNGAIAMQQSGVPITTMPAGSAGYLGIDLSDDHPVGWTYDNVNDPELKPWPLGNPAVKLDPDASNGKVECLTCHDPHNNQYTKFLRMSNANAGLCTTCHNKTNFASSIHATSTATYTPPGGSPTTVAESSCRSCHKPHSGGGKPYDLTAVEQNTCYNGTNTACHGASATLVTNRIESEMQKLWNHPANTIDGLHKDIPGGESISQLGSANRHAECQDCHNPHQAQTVVATATRGALRISAALKGSWGVEPTWPPAPTGMSTNDITWTTPTVYTKVTTPVDEYQVCLKCHSGYVSLPAGKRDIAQEINPRYTSYHGIVPGGTSNPNVNSTTTNEPWGTNRRVWCSDCHGSESSSSPQGPHGSTLNGVGPGVSNSDKMLIATIASSSSGTPLCLVCHKSTSYYSASTGSNYGEHNRANHHVAEGCFACHMWDHAGTSLATGGKSEKIIAHGLNKRFYWRENGTTLTAGTRVMSDCFNEGYISDVDYGARKCFTDDDATRGCNQHTNGKTY